MTDPGTDGDKPATNDTQVETSAGRATPVSMATVSPATVPPDNSLSHYVVEEEFTIGVPLVRPKKTFLEVLRIAGASGEVFTKKEICQYLKDYIGSRQLYDENDPRVVHCGNDLLGTVFGLDRFTIDDVLDLLTKHCTRVPDTCLKRKRHLVKRPLMPWSSVRAHTQPSSVTVAVCRSSPIITSTTSQRKPRKSHSSVSGEESSATVAHGKKKKEENGKKKPRSRKLSSRSTGGLISVASSNSCDTVTVQSAVDTVLPSNSVSCDQSLSDRLATKGEAVVKRSESSEDVKPAEEKKGEKRKHLRDSPDGTNNRRKRHQTEPPHKDPPTPGQSRRRGTSLSITIPSDAESSYPWYFEVEMGNGGYDDDVESEVLSIQGHETATVQDSTDDMWFVEEESVTVAMDSDTEFSVEYEVDSDSTQVTESDISSVKSGEGGFLVVCKESDVEFFADYSDSESETNSDLELSEADKWACSECQMINPPFQRYCDRCWKLRTGWLPDAGARKQIRTKSKYIVTSSSDNESVKTTADHECCKNQKLFFEDQIHKDSDLTKVKPLSSSLVNLDAFDSGIGGFSSPQPSSQETSSLANQISSSQEPATVDLEGIGKNNRIDYNTNFTDRAANMMELRSEKHALDLIEFDLKQVNKMIDTDIKYGANLESHIKSAADICSATGNAVIKPNLDTVKSSLQIPSHPKSLLANQTSLLAESQGMEVRHSFSNVRLNVSSSSIESPESQAKGQGQESKESSKVVSSPLDDPCMICLSKPKTASLIHGNSGHQVCCFACAKRLKRRGKVCPVCRRPIQKVVRNYIL